MGLKYKNLLRLTGRGINVHYFRYIGKEQVADMQQLVNIISMYPIGSCRADHPILQTDLPFIAFEKPYDYQKLYEFSKQCSSLGCSAVLSTGRKYDKEQLCNVVINILPNSTIVIEVSEDKAPLRHMYRTPSNLRYFYGDASEKVKDFKQEGAVLNSICIADLEAALQKVYEVKLPHERVFEFTLYPNKVGVFNETIAFWQIY